MIKLKKVILASMMLGFSTMAAAQLDQDIYKSGYINKGSIVVGELSADYDAPIPKKPSAIGLAIEEEVGLMPRLIEKEVCDISDVYDVEMSPLS